MVRSAGLVIVALVLASALMTGCAPEGAVEVTPTEEPSPTAAASPTPTREEPPTGVPEPSPTAPPPAAPEVPDDARAAVTWARQDLASRLNAAEEAIALVSLEAVEWRDSSLGCPQPGQVYLQVITPGYRFVLRAEGVTYEYHSARGADQAILCETTT